MSEEFVPNPPNIWRYEECAAANTDGVNMKEYKPAGTFYADAAMLCGLFNIKLHPIFREPPTVTSAGEDPEAVGGFDEQNKRKEPTTISISKYRIDGNSMKVLFKVLEGCPHIQTLKLQNNGLTISTFNKLIGYLAADNCPIVNLFVDWNPIYSEDFVPGDKKLGSNDDKLYVPGEGEEEQNPWGKLIESNRKLQVLFMRSSGLKDADVSHIVNALKANQSIKVIDISSNSGLSGSVVEGFAEVMASNRTIEYLGLSKLGLSNEQILPILDSVGKFPFPEDQVENQLAEIKKRDAIVEKNKKLKASKKPEEPVPQVDNIEQVTTKNDAGEDVQEWVTIKNPQLKHLNVCMNELDDDAEEEFKKVYMRTQDDFGMTVSSNKLSEGVIENLHSVIRMQHKKNIDLAIQFAEENQQNEEIKEDPYIHIKRLSV